LSPCHLVILLGLASSLLLAVAFPPIGFAPAVWIAPVGLILLVRQDRLGDASSLIGRHPYLVLWCTGLVFWLIAVHWLRLPHWAGYFSWTGLSALMACYVPLFVGLSRVLVHRWRVPVIVAAPVVWTGLELLRAYVPDGFPMASLYHAHYRWPLVIQVADLAGGYTLSFAIVTVAACVARMIPWNGGRAAGWPAVPLAIALAATLGYGYWRFSSLAAAAPPTGREVRVALIQPSFDTTFERDPGRARKLYEAMDRLSLRALRERPDLDLVIWPETLVQALVRHDEADALVGCTLVVLPDCLCMFAPAGNAPAPDVVNLASKLNQAAGTRASFILGAEFNHAHLAADQRTIERTDDYNASLLVNPHGQVLGRYDKMHAVIFGEYMPLGDYLPWLYHLSPLRDGLCEGKRPESFEVAMPRSPLRGEGRDEGQRATRLTSTETGGVVRFCPSICYESTMPQEVRRSVQRLRAEGREPDVLVNQTNSGWFWASSELDLHLACNVLRAVECRKPMLVAANTGISAWIDERGQIVKQGLRHDEDIVYATVGPSHARSLYTYVGDWPAALCLLICGLAVLSGLHTRWRKA
jgi:apolipoprotein N-acyltransferase